MDSDQGSRLLSLTSHELRSPLGVIRGYLKLLEQQAAGLTDQQKQVVAASLRASERMAELLAEVSAFAHLHCGDTPIEPKRTTVTGLLEQLLEAHAATPHGRTLHLGDVPPADVLVDAPLVLAALATIVAAVAAARPRDAALHLSVDIDGQRGARAVRLSVTGAPLSGDITEVPLNLLRGGLGLRLPLAATVVDAHRGRMLELHCGGRLAGMAVWLPVQPEGA
jgi:signal transduction histidine kinase